MNGSDLLERPRVSEAELHRLETRRSTNLPEQLLHPDFVEFARSGRRYSRSEVLAEFSARPASCNGVFSGRRYGWRLTVAGKYAFTRVRRRRQRQSPNYLGRFGTILAIFCAGILASACVAPRPSPNLSGEAELIRQTEVRRLRSLVEADMEVARALHADAFQLINPTGGAFTKDQYLGAIASGVVDYLIWEPDSSIEVKVAGNAAAIRYRSRIEIVVNGQHLPLARFWHTDTYEKLDNVWQVVWSQATEIR